MKKTLLSIFCAMALSVPAMADQIVATFINSEKYPGDCKNIVTFPETAQGSVDQILKIGDVCTFDLLKCQEKAVIKAADNPHLQLPKSAVFDVIPASGITITGIYFRFTTPNQSFPISASSGKMVAEDLTSEENPFAQWEGESDSAIKFTVANPNAAVRFIYFEITYTSANGDSGVASIAIDENAPVKYYNLQGMEVTNPKAGTMVICKQGANTKKIIVR